MKKRKILLLVSPLITFMTVAMLFNIPLTIANFIDYFIVDTNQNSFIDETTQNFICYPLQKANQNDPDICAIGWAKDVEESTEGGNA